MNILLLDDEIEIVNSLEKVIKRFNYDCRIFTNPFSALASYKTEKYDLIIVDYKMPEMTGLDFVREIRKMKNPVKVIMMTAFADLENVIDALNLDIFRYFKKPIEIKEMLRCIQQAEEELLTPNGRESKLEKSLQISQKFEALGVMAGGIAHDFNNILAPILGYAELAMHVIEKNSRVYEYMEEIVSASSRAKDLVNQILNFSRSKELGNTTFSLSALLKESMKLFRAALPDNYKLNISVSKNNFPINADPTKVTQIIFNLCTNAYHAMEEMETGKLSIDLDFAEEDDLAHIQNIKPDTKYIRLKISDTGTGIPFEIQDKIFDPFFTTKDSSKGTGLGLHMVKQLVEEFEGALSLISIINEGTTFYIYLPISKTEMTASIKNEKQFESGSGNVMIVDDNDSIIKLLEKACKNLGYNTIAERSSKQALYIYEFVAENVDIAIIDLLMPEMNGPALLKELRKFNPDLPAIFISGSDNVLNDELDKMGNYEFILKPVMISDLSSKIKQIINK